MRETVRTFKAVEHRLEFVAEIAGVMAGKRTADLIPLCHPIALSSLKVDVAADAGATGVLIGLVAGGDAVSFSFGGGDTFVPTLVIQQSLSNDIKANLAAPVNVSFSPASAVPLIGSMASTSSRGPSYSWQTIKPEIGAPGASLSAEAGTGDGMTVFGGTSALVAAYAAPG